MDRTERISLGGGKAVIREDGAFASKGVRRRVLAQNAAECVASPCLVRFDPRSASVERAGA